MERSLLLLSEDDDAWSQLSEERQAELMEKYGEWSTLLHRNGQLLGRAALGGRGVVVERQEGKIVQRPDDATKNVPTGYFIITAKNLADAAQIARGCPALDHGERVTIRPL